VTGKPSDASAEEGAELFEAMVSSLVERLAVAVEEEPPLPPEDWNELSPVE